MRNRSFILTIIATLCATLTVSAAVSAANAVEKENGERKPNSCQQLGVFGCAAVLKLQSLILSGLESYKNGKLSREELKPLIEFAEKWTNSLPDTLIDLKSDALLLDKKLSREEIEKELRLYSDSVRSAFSTYILPALKRGQNIVEPLPKNPPPGHQDTSMI